MPEFYVIIAPKNIFPDFFVGVGGVTCSPSPRLLRL